MLEFEGRVVASLQRAFFENWCFACRGEFVAPRSGSFPAPGEANSGCRSCDRVPTATSIRFTSSSFRRSRPPTSASGSPVRTWFRTSRSSPPSSRRRTVAWTSGSWSEAKRLAARPGRGPLVLRRLDRRRASTSTSTGRRCSTPRTWSSIGELAVVGTANLDNRSFRLELRDRGAIYGSGGDRELAATFERDLPPAERSRREQIQNRVARGSFRAGRRAPVLDPVVKPQDHRGGASRESEHAHPTNVPPPSPSSAARGLDASGVDEPKTLSRRKRSHLHRIAPRGRARTERCSSRARSTPPTAKRRGWSRPLRLPDRPRRPLPRPRRTGCPRLRGYMKTDAKGRYSYRTIRPGSYPNSRIPAHIHTQLWSGGYEPQYNQDLNFADDPFISESDQRESAAAGRFAWICAPERRRRPPPLHPQPAPEAARRPLRRQHPARAGQPERVKRAPGSSGV